MTPIIKNGPACAALRLELGRGEMVKAVMHSLVAMSDTMAVSSKADGGFLRSLARKFSGESFLFHQIVANAKGWVLLAPTMYGAVVMIDLDDKQIIATQDAFLAAASTVEISNKSPAIDNDIATLKFSGTGMLALNAAGMVEPFILLAGQSILVKPTYLIAYEDGTVLQTTLEKMTKVIGPARVWVQTRQSHGLPALPHPSKSGNS